MGLNILSVYNQNNTWRILSWIVTILLQSQFLSVFTSHLTTLPILNYLEWLICSCNKLLTLLDIVKLSLSSCLNNDLLNIWPPAIWINSSTYKNDDLLKGWYLGIPNLFLTILNLLLSSIRNVAMKLYSCEVRWNLSLLSVQLIRFNSDGSILSLCSLCELESDSLYIGLSILNNC